ncbi:MAG: hypothetical protein ACYC9R_12910 [Nitrosotalea sp.]
MIIHSLYISSQIMKIIVNQDGITFNQISNKIILISVRTLGIYLSQLVSLGFLQRIEEITQKKVITANLNRKFITHYRITARGREFLAMLKESLPFPESAA